MPLAADFPATEMHVWLLPRPDAVQPCLLAFVTAEEKAYSDTITGTRRKTEWLAARALLRSCLSHYTGSDVQALVFGKTDEGKPLLVRPADAPAFNLSHGPRWIACAVARVACIGIDIDSESRRNRTDDIAAHYFHPQEQENLRAMSDANARQREFFRCWTLKEAFIKAMGETISSTRLHEIAFAGEAGSEQTALFVLPSGCWRFLHWHFDRDHHLALAYNKFGCDTATDEKTLPCRFWQWDPQTGLRQPFAVME